MSVQGIGHADYDVKTLLQFNLALLFSPAQSQLAGREQKFKVIAATTVSTIQCFSCLASFVKHINVSNFPFIRIEIHYCYLADVKESSFKW